MRIAIVDPDPADLALIQQLLEKSGFDCHPHESPEAMRATPARRSPAALVCAVPHGIAGHAALELIRARGDDVPTLATIAGGAEDDIIAALSAGANDYLLKPIRPSELIARLQALLRRAYPHEAQERFVFEPFTFDADACQVAYGVDGTTRQVTLTQKEFDLGLILFRNAGRPLSRNHIRELVWGGDADVSSRTMDTHVSRLRTKLELGPATGFRVMPVYGYGYRLDRLEAQGSP